MRSRAVTGTVTRTFTRTVKGTAAPLGPPSRAALLLALLTVALAGGCGRDAGAIVARWRLWDAALGRVAATCGLAQGEQGNTCCGGIHGDVLDSDDGGVHPERQHAVFIDTIRLHVQRISDVGLADGGAAGDACQPVPNELDCKSCFFQCARNESTTEFEIPEGDYKLWLEPLRCCAAVPRVDTPPAVVRHVTAGEITNLDAIQLLLHPDTCPTKPLCAAPIDLGCNDLTTGGVIDLASGG